MYKGYEQIQKQKNKVNKHMKNEKKKKREGSLKVHGVAKSCTRFNDWTVRVALH